MHELQLENSKQKFVIDHDYGALWERPIQDREGRTAPQMDVISTTMQQI